MAPPNVLLLVVDSLRADAVFEASVATPNLDRLAARGAAFHGCVSTTTTTTTSVASLLTGCYPPRHGVRGLKGYSLSPTLPTLAQRFADAGYSTHARVTGPLLPETGVLRGFHDARHRPQRGASPFDWAGDIRDEIRSFSQPWFLLLHIWEVHRPFKSPPDFRPRWDRSGYEAAVGATDDVLGTVFEALPEDTIAAVTGDHGEQYPDTILERAKVRGALVLRRALDPIQRFPRLHARVAPLTVGHGFAIHEHLVRVPLILAGPGIPPRVIDDQVRHVDIMPTLLGHCAIEMATCDGRSLRPWIEGDSLPDEPAYLEAGDVSKIVGGERAMGARTSHWKLVANGEARSSLYRLDGNGDDRGPDVSRDHPEVVSELQRFMERVSASSTGDSGMTEQEEATLESHLHDLGYL